MVRGYERERGSSSSSSSKLFFFSCDVILICVGFFFFLSFFLISICTGVVLSSERPSVRALRTPTLFSSPHGRVYVCVCVSVHMSSLRVRIWVKRERERFREDLDLRTHFYDGHDCEDYDERCAPPDGGPRACLRRSDAVWGRRSPR